MEANSQSWRKQQFKSSATAGAAAGQRRRHQAQTVSKERREALVRAKRVRREAGDDVSPETVGYGGTAEDPSLQQKVVEAVEALKKVRSGPSAGGAASTVETLRILRKLLSQGALPPVGVAVSAGVVPVLVDCLGLGAVEDQLLEAAWCLTNIASGDSEQTSAILPAAPLLVLHLGSNTSVGVAEQCAWALGNVAGESAELREVLLANGALLPLSRLLMTSRGYPSLQRTSAWALSNLLKGPGHTATTEFLKLDGTSKALTKHLDSNDSDLITEIAWVLTYLTAGPESHTDRLIKAGVLQPLVKQFCKGESQGQLIPLLRCIGNIVSGSDSKTEAVFGSTPDAVIGTLTSCLRSSHRVLQKEAAWALSNIAGGGRPHKESLFSGGAVPALLELLCNSTFDIKKEAAFALANTCISPPRPGGGASLVPEVLTQHLVAVVEGGAVPGFLSLIRAPDPEAARLGLQFTELVLRALPGGQGPKLVEAADGIDALESLQFSENDELRVMANQLVDKYYGEDYGVEEEGHEGNQDIELPPWRTGNVM